MYLVRFNHAEDFYKRAEPFLLRYEMECNVIIGLCTNLIRYPERILEHPYMAVVEMAGAVIAVAMRTPPYNLLISVTEEEEALELIARDVYSLWKTLPGVVGPSKLAHEFADIWHKMSGQPHELEIAERLFRLDVVNPVNGVSGMMRRAAPDDRETLIQWYGEFMAESLPGELSDQAMIQRAVDTALEFETRGFYVWDDGQIVAFAGYTGPTPNSLRIGPVYTPPQFRRKGYASALVAGLSQLLLDDGRQFLTLYTDSGNPTSNHIYQEIGYYTVMDVDMVRFHPPTSEDTTNL
jgi:uncharacterized protein